MSLADENSFCFLVGGILDLIELAHHLKLIPNSFDDSFRFMPLKAVHLHAVSYS